MRKGKSNHTNDCNAGCIFHIFIWCTNENNQFCHNEECEKSNNRRELRSSACSYHKSQCYLKHREDCPRVFMIPSYEPISSPNITTRRMLHCHNRSTFVWFVNLRDVSSSNWVVWFITHYDQSERVWFNNSNVILFLWFAGIFWLPSNGYSPRITIIVLNSLNIVRFIILSCKTFSSFK